MKRDWWCSIVLAFVLFGLSCLVSLVRDQVFAQQQTVSAMGPLQGTQVVVRQQPEPLRCFVDIAMVDDPDNPARKTQILTIVDPESKHILVYKADMGRVKLLSVRDFQPDLLLDQYNAVDPTPSEIRKEIQRLRNQTP